LNVLSGWHRREGAAMTAEVETNRVNARAAQQGSDIDKFLSFT